MKPRFALVAVIAALGLGMASQTQAQTTWNSVTLSWTTPGDDSLTGTASQFDLRYSTSLITAGNYASATRFMGTPVPAAPGTSQSVVVTGLNPGTTYYFILRALDERPNISDYSNVASGTTATCSAPAAAPSPFGAAADTGQVSVSWGTTSDPLAVSLHLYRAPGTTGSGWPRPRAR